MRAPTPPRCARAREAGDRYVLNGSKMWITNGSACDTVVVYARTDPNPERAAITAFLVEGGSKGFSRAQKLDKLGMRGSDTCELVFEDCEVPAENILGGLNEGWQVLMSGLDLERVVLRRRPARHHAGRDGRGAALHPRAQAVRASRLASSAWCAPRSPNMYVTMNACKAYVYAVAKACDRGETTREDSAGAILYAAERATPARARRHPAARRQRLHQRLSGRPAAARRKLYEIAPAPARSAAC